MEKDTPHPNQENLGVARASALATSKPAQSGKLPSLAEVSKPDTDNDNVPSHAWDVSEQDVEDLLGKLVAAARHAQDVDRPSDDDGSDSPREKDVVQVLLDFFAPHDAKNGNGGRLDLQVYEYVSGRPNLVVTFDPPRSPATSKSDRSHSHPQRPRRRIGLMGAHTDVVPADPKTWSRDPFTLARDGDKLYGRGTSDCLCNVAITALVMRALSQHGSRLSPKTPTTTTTQNDDDDDNAPEVGVVAVFIACEEADEADAGAPALVKAGVLRDVMCDGKSVVWLDGVNSKPLTGSSGVAAWRLTATGRRSHSGFPQDTVNSIELAMAATLELQRRFHKACPPRKEEETWGFESTSTMKPTQIASAQGSIGQIPPRCVVCGDIRLTPFYDAADVADKVKSWADGFNADLSALEDRSALSPDSHFGESHDRGKGHVAFEWLAKDPRIEEGIACSLDSPTHAALVRAVESVKKSTEAAKPVAMGGSLPSVRMLQRDGFDVQIIGFGVEQEFHADDEFCLMSDVRDGFKVLCEWLGTLSSSQ